MKRTLEETPQKIIDLQKLIKNYGINGVVEENKTWLHRCVIDGSVEEIEYLISNHINLNAMDDYGKTALFYAVEQRRLEVVEILLKAGADCNAASIIDGITALHKAVDQNSLDIAKMLLEAGADYNLRIYASNLANQNLPSKYTNLGDLTGQTPFLVACTRGNDHMIILLFNKAEEDKAIKISLDTNNLDNLASYDIVNQPDYNNYTPLHLACIDGHISTVKVLIELGANVNAQINKNLGSLTPLNFAVKNEKANEIVEILLNNGADIKLNDINGNNVLFYAVDAKNAAAIKLLVPMIDIHILNNNKTDVINFAAIKRDYGIVKLLISEYLLYYNNFLKNNDPNIINKKAGEGATLLHRAVETGDMELIKMVIEAGADFKAKDDQGKTPIDWANEYGQNDDRPEDQNLYLEILQLFFDCENQDNNITDTNNTIAITNIIGSELKDSSGDSA